MNIIGLGNCGCNIAQLFAQYPQYNLYLFDSEERKDGYIIPPQNTIEEYENNFPEEKVRQALQNFYGDALLILSSAGKIAGATLRLASLLHNPTVALVLEDPQILTAHSAARERCIAGVLQEYARSGCFKKIILIRNSTLAELLGGIPIAKYHEFINKYIVNCLHMINIFEHTRPIIGNWSEPVESARIWTFGTTPFEPLSHSGVFEIAHARQIDFYFGIPQIQLESDGALLGKIKKSLQKTGQHATYRVYSTQYDEPIIYFMASTNLIQDV